MPAGKGYPAKVYKGMSATKKGTTGFETTKNLSQEDLATREMFALTKKNREAAKASKAKYMARGRHPSLKKKK